MSLHPDVVYDKTRIELLPFEDTELGSLLANIPDYYISANEETLYGAVLKATAYELGRLEYQINYDLVSRDPKYLNPADIKRRYEEAVRLNKSYPTKTMYDRDFKTLVLDLIKAYRQGSRVKTIEDVVRAYTGFEAQVVELYTLIGNGFYDQSDRNAINISVSTPNDNLSEAIQIVTRDLYGAIDVAKPAHVGINLAAVFTEDPENLDTYITEITDGLTIFVKLRETELLEGEFIVAPFFQAESGSSLAGGGNVDPDNLTDPAIAGFGLLAPRLLNAWEIKSDTLIGLDLD